MPKFVANHLLRLLTLKGRCPEETWQKLGSFELLLPMEFLEPKMSRMALYNRI